MKSIFLNQSEQTVRRVYSKELIERLKIEAGLEDCVFSKEQLMENPEKFKDTRFVFSTWDMPVMTEDEIKKHLPLLEAVFYGAGSVQHFARPFLNCGVKVFSAWAANAVPVAEYTIAQIILANKGYFVSSAVMSGGNPHSAKAIYEQYRGNYGANIGIIGAGMIGKLVIKMLKAYQLNLLVFDPFLPDEAAEKMGVKKVDLETLFSQCSVVSNHLANNKQTEGMLNYSLFSRMKQNAVFLNTGRGAQVVEDDLVKILTERKDLTAILDVTMPEPPIEGHEFYALSNCILTPHIAGSSGDEVHRMAAFMLDEYNLLTSGGNCKYEVTLEMLATMA